MLVLSRKVGEQVLIDHEIVLKVLQVRGGRIQLGIIAPAKRQVVRVDAPPKVEKQREAS